MAGAPAPRHWLKGPRLAQTSWAAPWRTRSSRGALRRKRDRLGRHRQRGRYSKRSYTGRRRGNRNNPTYCHRSSSATRRSYGSFGQCLSRRPCESGASARIRSCGSRYLSQHVLCRHSRPTRSSSSSRRRAQHTRSNYTTHWCPCLSPRYGRSRFCSSRG